MILVVEVSQASAARSIDVGDDDVGRGGGVGGLIVGVKGGTVVRTPRMHNGRRRLVAQQG